MSFAAKNVDDAATAKAESVADYYRARLEALEVKSTAEADAYRPVSPELLYLRPEQFARILMPRRVVRLTPLSIPDDERVANAGVVPSRDFSFNKSINPGQVYSELKDYLSEYKKLRRIVFAYSEGSRERLFSLMSEYETADMTFAESWEEAVGKAKSKVVLVVANLAHGFRGDGWCLVSEQDILGERQHRRTAKKVSSKDFIADVSALSVGELVVHIEHGIGKFLGLENIMAGGAPHDCLKILYANDAKLFVPVENIDVISRYGIEDDNIQLDTIGGLAWRPKKPKSSSVFATLPKSLSGLRPSGI